MEIYYQRPSLREQTITSFIFAAMKLVLYTLLCGLLSVRVCAQKFVRPFIDPVNTGLDEQNPIISPDGRTLWFTVEKNPENMGGKKDLGDIWYSTWTGVQWSPPVHAGGQINDRGYNALAGISGDGNALVLFNHYDKSGSPAKSQGISISRKTNSGWSIPEKVTIPYFLNRSPLVSGTLSRDGSVLVYSAESYDSRGAEDLYVTVKNAAGLWTEPKNLGAAINTSFQELSPSLSADLKYLYFSTNGRRGYGSFDVYYSERLDDSWTNWSAPTNMGSRINSDGRELYYRTYPQFDLALYTSTQNSDGYGDIRAYLDTLKTTLPDTLIKMVEIKHENFSGKDEKRSTIKGMVTDSKTGQPIAAKLVFRSDSTYRASSSTRGNYSLKISSTNVYTIVVEASGYVGVLEKLDIHTFEMKVVELNFRLQPIEIGATVNLKNVLFQVAATNLLPESYDELNVVYDLLRTNPKIEIELAGHTDNRGDARMNLQLSERRVDVIKAYLVSKGISGKRIKGKGYGGQRPIANGDTEESKRLNRRVEFTIVKD